jgi:DNA-binding CsgD family transcriptional regulator
MIRLTGLPRWYIKRQAARLGLTMHTDRRPWTRAELDVLEHLVGCVSSATIAKRLGRAESSVVNKLKRMQTSRRLRNGYTMRDLEMCLGEDHHKIAGWIKNGWLQDHLQGTLRHDGNGNDIHRIREEDILNFVRNHPQEINLGKVDQTWFLDLVLLKGRDAHQAKRIRSAAATDDEVAA